MGFGDKLKGLRDQAQQAVAENKDRIQDAVQVVGEAANSKTHGKYATKIAHVGEKVSGSVDRFAGGAAPEDAPGEAAVPAEDAPGEAAAPAEDAPGQGAAPAAAAEPAAPAPTAEPAPSSPPEFE